MQTVKTTIETITPEIAKEYLTHNVVNRKASNGIIDFYARMMKEGKWMLNGESIVFDKDGNLVDGQHRLKAVIKSGCNIQSVVVRDVENYSFLSIDQGKARSSADAFTIKGISNASAKASAIRKFLIMNRCDLVSMEAINCGGERNAARRKTSPEECLREYEKRPLFWDDEIRFASVCNERCRLLTISEITAISAYLQLTHRYESDFVREFFVQLFFEEKTKNTTLSSFRRIVVNDAMSPNGMKMTGLYKTQILVKCWDYYKQNKQITLLRWNSATEAERFFS